MNPERKEILENTFTTVLEKLAFMFAELVEKEELSAIEEKYLKTSLDFNGPIKGILSLLLPLKSCEVFAANILGTNPDTDLAHEDAKDSISELVNVTCGHILTELAGEDVVFDLGTPQCGEISSDDWQMELDNPQSLSFLVDDIPVLLKLEISE